MGTRSARSRRVPPSFEQCEVRRLLTVIYHGGAVLQHVGVQTVYFGKAWATNPELQQQEDLLDGFFTSITQSTFMDLLSEYSTGTQTIGRGSFIGRDVNAGSSSPSSGGTISDSQIQAMLRTEITSGHVAAPDADRVMFVITPPHVLVTNGNSDSVNDFLGYHGAFVDAQGAMIYYAVIAHPQGNADIPGLTDFQQLTEVSSHELAEAVTDPGSPPGWYQDSTGEEVADLANNAEGFLNDYVIEQVFSNKQNGIAIPLGATLTDPQDLTAAGKDLNVLEGVGSTGLVATFADGDSIASTSSFSAQIDWGDGTTTVGLIAADPITPGGFNVSGTHDYGATEAGSSSPLHVTITDLIDNQTVTAQSAAHIVEAPLAAAGLAITPTKGVSFSGPVATFVDANPFGASGDYTATIHWGDGSTSAGTVTARSGGGFNVSGTHTFSQEGLLQASAIIVDGGSLALASTTVTVADLPLTAVPQPISATEGAPFSGVVATFTDADPAGTAGDYTATIAWGDGSTSAGTIAANGAGGFAVSGTHTFGGVGSAPSVSVSILDKGGATASATLAAVVADAPLAVLGKAAGATEGTSFSGVVATFTDADPAGQAAQYQATIAWGDGSTSAGTIAANGAGGFAVSGTHTFAEDGAFPTSVAVTDTGGASATASGTVQVSDPAVIATGGFSLSGLEGINVIGTVATFVDPGGPEAAASYSATIAWGDGSTSPGTIVQSGGVFTVPGVHTYIVVGNQSIVVTIHHLGAPDATAQDTATVADAPLTGSAAAVTAQVGQPFSGVVATFKDFDPNATAANFLATITWGDGSTSAGTIAPSGGGFQVNGTHAYTAAGSFLLEVAVRDTGGASLLTDLRVPVTSEVAANFDGFGTSQFAVFRPSTAQWSIAGHAQPISFGAKNLADIPVPGDYDGTGRTQFALFRPATGQWLIAGHAQPLSFGARNLVDIPVPGDYDGTGHTELAVFRPSTGQWFIAGRAQPISFGAKNLVDIPVPGDYDAIGRTEPAVFRPSTGQWFILNPLTGSGRVVSFGARNLADIPVPGDYDGTGRTEVAVFRPSTAQWTILNPLTGTQRTVSYGAPNLFDIPVETSIGSLKRLGRIGGSKVRATAFSATAAPGIASAPSQPPATGARPTSRPRRNALAAHLAALDVLHTEMYGQAR